MTIQILIFICFVGGLLDKNNWSLLLPHLIMGTCVLVLSVTNCIPSYPDTETDKSMIFVFTSRIHIPHQLRNLPFLL